MIIRNLLEPFFRLRLSAPKKPSIGALSRKRKKARSHSARHLLLYQTFLPSTIRHTHGGPLMNRRRFLQSTTLAALAFDHAFAAAEPATLHNGIRLPADWPPRWKTLPYEPHDVPYLRSPPAVIPIDVGR